MRSRVGQKTWFNERLLKLVGYQLLFIQTWIFFPAAARGKRNPSEASLSLISEPGISRALTSVLWLMCVPRQLPSWKVFYVANLLINIAPLWVLEKHLHVPSLNTKCGWNDYYQVQVVSALRAECKNTENFSPKYYTGTHHRLEPTTPRWGWRWTRGAWEGQLKSVWKLCMHTWGQMQQSATARWNWRSSAGIQSTQKLHQEPELSVLVISLTSNVVFLTKPGTRQCRQLVERRKGTSRTSGSRPSPTFELNTQYYVPYVSVWVVPKLMPRTQQKPRAQ